MRGFHGSHVRDYVRATEPTFVVGEFWDSLAYNGGLPDHNQVRPSQIAPVQVALLIFDGSRAPDCTGSSFFMRVLV